MKVNWVFAELDFFDDCCSRRLLFSWPLTGVVGEAAASAIAVDIIPWSVDFATEGSVYRSEDEKLHDRTRVLPLPPTLLLGV